MITLRSCSSKWVNNQVEVNDRPMQKWRWWCKHAQGFKRLKSYVHNGHLPEIGSFFIDELERWKIFSLLIFIF